MIGLFAALALAGWLFAAMFALRAWHWRRCYLLERRLWRRRNTPLNVAALENARERLRRGA